MVSIDTVRKEVAQSSATLQLMDAVGHYFPHLSAVAPGGSPRVVAYRFGKLGGMKLDHEAYDWVRGSRRIPAYALEQLIYEILAVAEKERAELHQLREERRANAEPEGH